MTERIQVWALRCTCNACGYVWVSTGTKPPRWCQNRACRTRQWDGVKPVPRALKLPSPRKPGRPRSILLAGEEI